MNLPDNRQSLVDIGYFAKPHGYTGEISFCLTGRTFFAPNIDDWIFVNVDGIPVPFLIEGMRRKGIDWLLLKLHGVDNDMQAARLKNSTVYVSQKDFNMAYDEDEEAPDGYSAYEFIGFTAMLDGDPVPLGKIDSIDDSTANWLFHIKTPHGKTLLVPVADDFVTDIDINSRVITLSLPEGLLDI